MAKTVTMRTNDSPELTTWVGNATSRYYQTHRKDRVATGPVTVSASGTWSSVTVTVQQCNDLTASPQVWTSEGTLTANGHRNFHPADGAAIRVATTGSGSPLPSLTITMRGDFDGQTGT